MPLCDGALYRKNLMHQTDLDDEGTTYIDTEKSEKRCKGCTNLKNVLELAEKDQEALVETTKRFGEDIRNWERKYATLEKRSNDITARMAGVLEDSGNLENINDQYANTKLAKRFEDLYKKQWADLSEWLQENVDDMTELDRIKILTSLMKLAYSECHKTVDSQLRKFLFLEKNDMLPLPHEDPELYRLRRKNGQALNIRTTVKRKICKKILSTRDVDYFTNLGMDKKDKVKEKLQDFFEEFTDILWLMSISHPVLLLNFDVIGKPYSGIIKERFTQYSCQDDVIDKTLAINDVLEVVWPSVELENGEGVCTKGDVITVQAGTDNTEITCEKERKVTLQERKRNDAVTSDPLVVQKQGEDSGGVHVELNVRSDFQKGKEDDERLHDEGHIVKEDEFTDVDLT